MGFCLHNNAAIAALAAQAAGAKKVLIVGCVLTLFLVFVFLYFYLARILWLFFFHHCVLFYAKFIMHTMEMIRRNYLMGALP
ncbi:hypothetical protein AKJ16_DCAP22068 [Drosera capensis]